MFYIVTGFLMGAAGAWLAGRYAHRLGLIDVPEGRSSHMRPTPRGGGIGIWTTVAGGGIIGLIPPALALGACLIGAVSFVDDVRPLSARLRLALQLIVAGAVWTYSWTGHDAISMILLAPAILYVAGTANFFNFMDGINGIAAGNGFIAFVLLAVFSVLSGADQGMIWFCAAVAAACAGFLPFNIPKARVFMGDVGSVTLGFLFALCLISLTSSWPDFLCMASFLFLFYADPLTTLYIRWRDGEKLGQAHRRHLYQILANEYGIRHWLVSLVYAIVQGGWGCVMLFAWLKGPFFQYFGALAMTLIFLAAAWHIRRGIEVEREA